MPGFGIQKKGTSPLLVKRIGFSSGDIVEPKDPLEPMEEMEEYSTKETRLGKNQFKVERVKKSDDEKKLIKSAKEGARKVIKEVNKRKTFVTPTPRVNKAKGGQAKDTHVTKEGRVAKKGLYYYMNRAKKLGKSKPGKGTVTDKALKASAKTAKK